ncbi:MAG: hypothetical protein AVDCRST_MAG04-4027, partial [uncultured Acetobacteraceae bacterium]
GGADAAGPAAAGGPGGDARGGQPGRRRRAHGHPRPAEGRGERAAHRGEQRHTAAGAPARPGPHGSALGAEPRRPAEPVHAVPAGAADHRLRPPHGHGQWRHGLWRLRRHGQWRHGLRRRLPPRPPDPHLRPGDDLHPVGRL